MPPHPTLVLTLGLGALGLATLSGCQSDADTQTRSIVLHQLAECPLPNQEPDVALEALGDFPTTSRSSESLDANDAGRELTFPEATRALSALTSGLSERFVGLGQTQADQSALEVLLWPEGRSCAVAGDAAYPSRGGGQAMAYHPGRHLVLVAGGDAAQSSAVVGALTFDVATGSAEPVDAAARHVLLEPRAFAAAAPFGDNLIVTGGENPVLGSSGAGRAVQDSAEVYLVDEARFSTELIPLRVPRARHAATVLPSGEVLLIGGRSADGSALAVLEAISPLTSNASLGGLASLADARIEPRVARLSDGRLLVGGGQTADGEPVSSLEWLSSTAAQRLDVRDSGVAAYDVSLSPLPGGGALFVAGCAPTEDDSICAPCANGCPVDAASAAHWIREDGTLDAVALPSPAPFPELVSAADGATWLITGNDQAPLLRFNPWRARFEQAALRGPLATPVIPPLALDPGAFVWLGDEDEPRLFGVRHGTRDRYARDVALLTLTAPFDSSWPLHLCPSKKNDADETFDGALHLTKAPVWLTDVDFTDVDVELEFTGDLPLIWLSAQNADGASETVVYGGDERPWPAQGSSPTKQLRALRRADGVLLERDGSSLRYAAPKGRVTLAFSRDAAAKSATLTRLAVTRVATD